MTKDLYVEVPGNPQKRYIAADCTGYYLRSLLPNDKFVKMNQFRFTDVYFKDVSDRIFHIFIDEEGDMMLVASFLKYIFTPDEINLNGVYSGKKFYYGDDQKTQEIVQIQCVSTTKEYAATDERFSKAEEGTLSKEFHQWKAHKSAVVPVPVEELVVG